MDDFDFGAACIQWIYQERRRRREQKGYRATPAGGSAIEQRRKAAIDDVIAWDYAIPPEKLADIQQALFSHNGPYHLTYYISERFSDAVAALRILDDALTSDPDGLVLVRLRVDVEREEAYWVVVTEHGDRQVRYFDPTEEAFQTLDEAPFLQRMQCWGEGNGFGGELVYASAVPQDGACGCLDPGTLFGVMGASNLAVVAARGVYPNREMALVRARQSACAGYEDSVVVQEGCTYAVYGLTEIRIQGGQQDVTQIRWVQTPPTDLFYSSPEDKNQLLHREWVPAVYS